MIFTRDLDGGDRAHSRCNVQRRTRTTTAEQSHSFTSPSPTGAIRNMLDAAHEQNLANPVVRPDDRGRFAAALLPEVFLSS
jgi:hypothetical protein